MFDHIGFRLRNLEASRKFYLSTLARLGFGVARARNDGVGLRRDGEPDLRLI